MCSVISVLLIYSKSMMRVIMYSIRLSAYRDLEIKGRRDLQKCLAHAMRLRNRKESTVKDNKVKTIIGS